MQLPGRLARTTFGDLLGRIYRAGATGALELSLLLPQAHKHRIHVHRGLVVAVELGLVTPSDRLGEILVREGFATENAVARALARQELMGPSAPRHGEVLVKLGEISPELRDAALRKQARSRLDTLFTLVDGRDGEVRFHVGPAAQPAIPVMPAPLLPRDFLHGRRRARVTKREASTPPRLQLTFDRLRAMRLLGVNTDADAAAIRKAFRNAAARVHPDRHPDAPAHERARLHGELAELSAAYHLLCA